MTRFNEMMLKTEPPEQRCPRCGEYIDDDLDIDDEWSCDRCGYNGEPRFCVACDRPISPKSENFGTGMCDACTYEEQREQWENEDWEHQDWLDESGMSDKTKEYEGLFIGIILSGNDLGEEE